jgi:hypothetical protein
VGGYIDDGTLPRRFERTFATCIRTLDGPEWSHSRRADTSVPIEYWFDTGPHPEVRA